MVSVKISSSVYQFSRVLYTFIASIAYSTWKILPSGENVLTPLSYSERVKNMITALYLQTFKRGKINM